MEQNPYSPPQELRDETVVPAPGPFAPTTGVSLSEQGWKTVTSLSRWMRIVASFYLLLGCLIAVGVLAAVLTGNAASLGSAFGAARLFTTVGVGLFGAAIAVVFILGSIWLRKAAHGFYDGVLSSAEATLGLGFRKLRLYLILYGAFGLLTLAKDVYTLVVAASFGGR